jgi:WD40 repeat protein
MNLDPILPEPATTLRLNTKRDPPPSQCHDMKSTPPITRRQALALAGAVALPPARAQPARGWRLLHEHTLPETPTSLSWSHDDQHLEIWWPAERWARLQPGKGLRVVQPRSLPPPAFGHMSWGAYLEAGPAHSNRVADMAPDGQTVVIDDGAGALDWWALESPPRKIGRLYAPGRDAPGISAVRLSADGGSVLAGFTDGAVRRFDVRSRRVLARFQAAVPLSGRANRAQDSARDNEDPAVVRLELSPNGRWWVVCTAGGRLSSLRADTLAPTDLLRASVGRGTDQQIDFTDDSQVILLRDAGRNTLQARGVGLSRAFGPPWRLPFPTSAPWATSSTAGLLALNGARADGPVEVVSLRNGARKATLPMLQQPIQEMAFSPEGRHLLTLTVDGEGKVWQARSKPPAPGERMMTASARKPDPDPWPTPGSLVATLPGRLEHLAMSAGGRWVLATAAGGELLAFDRTKQHAVAHRQQAHGGRVVAMGLSSGGQLATVGADLRLKVWQVPTV